MSGRHTRQAQNPASYASSRVGKCRRFSGLVRRPGGQLGRQTILVVTHALNIGLVYLTVVKNSACGYSNRPNIILVDISPR
jgi:hypothetical protein